jgi:hypothetical protein
MKAYGGVKIESQAALTLMSDGASVQLHVPAV